MSACLEQPARARRLTILPRTRGRSHYDRGRSCYSRENAEHVRESLSFFMCISMSSLEASEVAAIAVTGTCCLHLLGPLIGMYACYIDSDSSAFVDEIEIHTRFYYSHDDSKMLARARYLNFFSLLETLKTNIPAISIRTCYVRIQKTDPRCQMVCAAAARHCSALSL